MRFTQSDRILDFFQLSPGIEDGSRLCGCDRQQESIEVSEVFNPEPGGVSLQPFGVHSMVQFGSLRAQQCGLPRNIRLYFTTAIKRSEYVTLAIGYAELCPFGR